jgi:hypothetical protein
MAIDFHFHLAPPTTAERVAATVLDLGGPQGVVPAGTTADELQGDGTTLRAGAWCRVTTPRPRSQPPPLEVDFGLVTACWLTFRVVPSNGSTVWQQDEMVWLVAGLLAHLPADAALHFQYEVLWLVRQEGRLVVNERDDIWTAERLAFLPPPFERGVLAFAE